jgi:PKD repeat protein
LIAWLLLLPASTGHAQIGPDIEWQTCYGGTSNEYGPRITRAGSNFLFLSSTNSNNGEVQGNHGNYDGWATLLDSSGQLLWSRCFGGSKADYAADVVRALDGGFLLLIYANSTDGQVTGSHGGSEMWVVKTDVNGDLQWQRPAGGSSSEIPYAIRQLPDSNVVVCGYTLSNDGDVSGNHGSGDAWLAKLTAQGELLWQRCYGGPQADAATTVQLLADGNLLVAGYTHSNSGDVSGNHGGRDAWVFKTDTSGNLLWQHCYGGTQDESFSAFRESPDFVELAGVTTSNDGDVSGNNGEQDFWLVKVKGDGELVEQKCFGGTETETFTALVSKPGGSLALCGESDSNDGDVIGNHSPGINDGWIMRADSSYQLIWSRCYGGSSVDFGFNMVAADEDHLLIAGATISGDGDINCDSGGLIELWAFQTADECDLPIQAQFSYVANNLLVNFKDESSKASAWYWEFGDGTTSTETNPVHEYAASGIYFICLLVTDSCGLDTACAILNTCGYAQADFSFLQSGLSFIFTDSSVNANQWLWNFGDGTGDNEPTVLHEYAMPGIYMVTLIASNTCHADSVSFTINTCGELKADFDFQTAELLVSFSDLSSPNTATWLWNFGDGVTSTQQNPVHLYELPGMYTVTLLVETDCESQFITKQVAVCASAAAGFSVSLQGNQISLSNNSTNATAFLWDFGNGETSTLPAPAYFFVDTGFYFICLTASNICSADDTCLTIHASSPSNIQYCWHQTFSENDQPDHSSALIRSDAAGNALVAGQSEKGEENLLFQNCYLLQYHPDGQLQWQLNLRNEFPDDYFQSTDLAIDFNGHGLLLFEWQEFPAFNSTWGLTKVSNAGAVAWTHTGLTAGLEEARAIDCDSAGNTIVAGTGLGPSLTRDFMLILFDDSGNQLWKKFYDYAGFVDAASDVAFGANGLIYVTGTAVADALGEHEKMLTVIFNSEGEPVEFFAEGNSHAYGTQVFTNGDGDAWVLGGESYFGEDPLIYLQRIGSQQWLQSYNQPELFNPEFKIIGLSVDSSDEAYVALDVEYADANNEVQLYPLILKYNEGGMLNFAQPVSGTYLSNGGEEGFVMKHMMANEAGKVFFAGYSKLSSEGNHAFEVEAGRISAQGVIEWISRFDAMGLEDRGNQLALDGKGNVLISGRTEAAPDVYEILTLKYCIECNPLPVVLSLIEDTVCDNAAPFVLTGGNPPGGVYSGPGIINGVFNPALAGPGNHLIVYSYADSDDCIANDSVIVVVSICSGIQNITDEMLAAYPNPFADYLFIRWYNIQAPEFTAELMEPTGRVLQSFRFSTRGTSHADAIIPRGNLPAGTYLLRLRNEKNTVIRKVIAVN